MATDSYIRHVTDRFGSDLSGLRLAVDCANGAYSGLAPRAFAGLGAAVTAIGDAPDGTNINSGCGATDLALLQETVRAGDFDLGVAFDGDGDRMLAVDATGEPVDGDQIVAVLALHLGVELVAVTSMTNLGFHRLMAERGVRVVTTDVGDRYVLEALQREGGVLGGEQSGHILYLDGHVTGDGLAAALLLCGALEGRTLAEAVSVMAKFPQVKENVRVRTKECRRTFAGRSTAWVRADGCSCGRPGPSPSSACSPRRSRARRPRNSVLALPLSFVESSAEAAQAAPGSRALCVLGGKSS